MLLSNEDIEHLVRKGYKADHFVRFNEEGYAVLLNLGGVCVFFDPEKRVCRERACRPLGCRIYPVLLDEDEGVVVDELCPARESIGEKERARRGRKVIRLLHKIDAEAEERRMKNAVS